MSGSSRSLAGKKSRIISFFNSISEEKRKEGKKQITGHRVNLKAVFYDKRASLLQPTEDDIHAILARTGKYTQEDQLNCGACGYHTCREKAIAVFQGIAEVDMCLPYLISQNTQLMQSIKEQLDCQKELNRENEAIIDCSYDGIVVTDAKGIITKVNPALEQLLHMTSEELIGMNVADMEKNGIVYPSATLLALKTGRPVTFLQKHQTGREVLATGNPVMDEKGKVTRVIVNMRDMKALKDMENKIVHGMGEIYSEEENLEELLNLRSPAFQSVMEVARKPAKIDSTLLVLGESDTGKKVAVIGSGPAGLSAAFFLKQWGHRVTIFEEHKEPGGMLVYAILKFRLPRNIIKHEIQRILDLGVNLVTGVKVGRDISLSKLRNEYDAVFVAVGSQEQLLLDIPGENLENVHTSFDFLKRANAGHPPYIGNKVAVIGGGNCAIDMARFAVRLGAKEVKMIYRRSAQDFISKIWACWFPIMLFVLAGFEHSIANMYFIPVGILAKANAQFAQASVLAAEKLAAINWGSFMVNNIIPVTIGNIIGGAVIVSWIYWYVYKGCKKEEKASAQAAK